MKATLPGGLLDWAFAQMGISGERGPALTAIAGDAGTRRYFRLGLADRSVLLVHAPPATEKNDAFVQVASLLAAAGVRVPELLALDRDRGFLLVEDMGDAQLLPALDAQTVDGYYTRAGRVLLQLAALEVEGDELPAYNADLLTEELSRFREWFVEGLLAYRLEAPETALWERVSARLVDSALAQPRVFVHRDFHSRNLMLTEDGALAVIDFQDAVLGPITYDLVSLLRDCYVRWPADRVRGWALAHRDLLVARDLLPPTDDARFLAWFDLMGLQRHLKVLGNFARLSVRDDRHDYLADLPMVLGYVLAVLDDNAAEGPDFAAFARWLRDELLPLARAQDWGAAL